MRNLLLFIAMLCCTAASAALPIAAVYVKDDPALRGDSTMTVEGWLYIEDPASASRLISKYGNSTNAKRGWELVMHQGKIRFRLNGLLANGKQQEFAVEDRNPAPAKEWIHVAASFVDLGNTDRMMVLYINGRQVAKRNLPALTQINPNQGIHLFAGVYAEYYSAQTKMLLDELRVSNNPPSFKGVPTKPYTGKEPGTLALFHFDSVNENVTAADGIVAGIEGQPTLVEGRFGKAIDLRGEIHPKLFKAVENRGKGLLLHEFVEGDFRLVWYSFQSHAELHLFNRWKKNIPLKLSVRNEKDMTKVLHEQNVLLKDHQIVRIPLMGLTDGRYIVSGECTDPALGFNGKINRMLRLQLPKPAPLPKLPVAVKGKHIFPVDDHHFELRNNIRVFAQTAEAIETSLPEGEMQVTKGSDWLGEDAQGRIVQRFVPAYMTGKVGPNRFAILDKNDKRTNVNLRPRYVPYQPAKFPKFRKAQRFSANRLQLDKVKLRKLTPADGMPPLEEVQVCVITPSHNNGGLYKGSGDAAKYGLVQWGTYAFWEKTPGEWIQLTPEPLAVCKFSYGETELDAPLDSNDCWGDLWFSADGQLCYAQSGKNRRFAPFIIEYDNIATSFRQMRQFSTKDGINWQVRHVQLADERDHYSTQHYGSNVFQLEDDFYITIIDRYDVLKQQVNPEAWFSRDGLDWFRADFPKNLVVNTDVPRSWLFGMIFTDSTTPILEKDGNWFFSLGCAWNRRMHFYFLYGLPASGKNTAQKLQQGYQFRRLEEKWPFFHEIGGYTGLAEAMAEIGTGKGSTAGFGKMRAYGFFSATAVGRNAELISRPFTAPGSRMTINGKGKFTVEILDTDGKAIPGYSGSDAAVFNGDSTKAELQFGGKSTLPAGEFKVRIRMADKSELYDISFPAK